MVKGSVRRSGMLGRAAALAARRCPSASASLSKPSPSAQAVRTAPLFRANGVHPPLSALGRRDFSGSLQDISGAKGQIPTPRAAAGDQSGEARLTEEIGVRKTAASPKKVHFGSPEEQRAKKISKEIAMCQPYTLHPSPDTPTPKP